MNKIKFKGQGNMEYIVDDMITYAEGDLVQSNFEYKSKREVGCCSHYMISFTRRLYREQQLLVVSLLEDGEYIYGDIVSNDEQFLVVLTKFLKNQGFTLIDPDKKWRIEDEALVFEGGF